MKPPRSYHRLRYWLWVLRHPMEGTRARRANREMDRLLQESREARVDRDLKVARLIANLAERSTELNELFGRESDTWHFEDGIYRYYHQSWKVYRLQQQTEAIVTVLQDLLPGQRLHPWFRDIIAAGTGRHWELLHNADWPAHTRPIVEAYFHARYFLEMTTRYAGMFDEEPQVMPSGWAALLYLYQLR